MSDFLKNVVTLGAHGRTKRAHEEYENCVQEARSEWAKLDRMVDEARRQFQRLDSAAGRAADVLQQHAALVPFGVQPQPSDGVLSLPGSMDGGSAVPGVAVGTAAGLLTSSAVTGAVGVLGTASTGTAIAGLAGAAKTSATLAWLGGGSIATGGGGMFVGTLVSGALVAVPLVAIMAMFSHRRAGQVEAECKERIADVRRQVQQRANAVEPWVAKGNDSEQLAAEVERLTHRFLAAQDYLPASGRQPQRSRFLRVLLWPWYAFRSWLCRRRVAGWERARSQLMASLARANALWASMQTG
jgi:hypothetical protein